MLWPVTIAKDGSVKLASQFYDGSGPGVEPLKEFDIFGKAFGRRKIKASPSTVNSITEKKP